MNGRANEKSYDIFIRGFADTFGVTHKKVDEFVEHILETARIDGQLSLRMIIVTLIDTAWSLKSDFAIAALIANVEDIIPEDL